MKTKQEKEPLISIIVPVYNVEKYIKKCLQSLVQQTYANLEIIVIVDGSQDTSIDYVKAFYKEYPKKIKYFETENRGLSSARNLGIQKSKGCYIGFVDSDDYVETNMFEKMMASAIKNNSDLVVSGYYRETNTEKKEIIPDLKNTSDKKEVITSSQPYVCNKIFKRNLLSDETFKQNMIFEDIPVVYPLLLTSSKISFVNKALYYYNYKREGSILDSKSDKILDIYKSLSLFNNEMKKLDMFENYYSLICYINLKHTLLRFHDFKNYKNIKLQRKILKEGFNYLNKNFPKWKKNFYFESHKSINKYYLCWMLKIYLYNIMRIRQKIKRRK